MGVSLGFFVLFHFPSPLLNKNWIAVYEQPGWLDVMCSRSMFQIGDRPLNKTRLQDYACAAC